MKTGIYLTFDGNCREAMDFYRSVFGGNFPSQATWGEAPNMEVQNPELGKNLIMHCALPLSETFTLMGRDRHPAMYKNEHIVGNNTEISLSPETKDEADRLFASLSEGGVVKMPLAMTFWGSYYGTCKDKYGIQWMFDTVIDSKDGKVELEKSGSTADANDQAETSETLAEGTEAKKLKVDNQVLEKV